MDHYFPSCVPLVGFYLFFIYFIINLSANKITGRVEIVREMVRGAQKLGISLSVADKNGLLPFHHMLGWVGGVGVGGEGVGVSKEERERLEGRGVVDALLVELLEGVVGYVVPEGGGGRRGRGRGRGLWGGIL